MKLSDNINYKTSSYRERGFAIPTVLIFVLGFVAIPILYLAFNSDRLAKESVKGAATQNSQNAGLYVQVTSSNGGWELSEVLCKELEECKKLNEGKTWGTLNGGQTEGSTIKIDYSEMFSPYNYLKLFVKPSWNSGGRDFKSSTAGDMQDITTGEIKDDVGTYSYVIVSLEELKADRYSFISFTDK